MSTATSSSSSSSSHVEVVVFNDPTARSTSKHGGCSTRHNNSIASDKRSWSSFMSDSVARVHKEGGNHNKVVRRSDINEEDNFFDEESMRKARLDVSRLGLEGMDKRIRKKAMEEQLVALGGKPLKKARVGIMVGRGMKAKTKERQDKRIQFAINTGVMDHKQARKSKEFAAKNIPGASFKAFKEKRSNTAKAKAWPSVHNKPLAVNVNSSEINGRSSTTVGDLRNMGGAYQGRGGGKRRR